MQTIRRAQVIAPAVLVLLVALVAAGCSPGAAATGPATTGPATTGALVTVETRGGECVNGPCGTTVVLERDGRVHAAAKPPNDLGTVPPELLGTLDRLIATTDFAVLKSRPFTGQCPTAYDGQEIVFEFGAPGGVQRIATCEVDVDFGLPLFVAVSTALGPFVPLPTT
jgi:hypothetical protein